MRITYRELVGLPIRDREKKALLGRVADLVVNPDDGKIPAIFVHNSRKLIVPTVDVLRMTREAIFVADHEVLATPQDIVRIDEIIQQKIPILKNKVFTVSRQFLGNVIDFEIETNGWVVAKLDVAKTILNIPTQQKLIDAREIVRITKTEITVQDAVIKIPAKTAKVEADAEPIPT